MYWTEKRMLPIPALTGADLALRLSFRHWNEHRTPDYLPPRCQIDTPAFRLLVPDVHWIDLRGRRSGEPIDLGPLAPFGDAVSASYLHKEPVTLADALLDDLENAAFVGAPMFILLDLSVQGKLFSYQLLIAPHSDDGSNVGELALVCAAGEPEFAPA